MKHTRNQLFVVFGATVNEDDNYNVEYLDCFRETRYYKNKEKALDYVELLLDDYMKTKSYSPNYEITETYKDNNSVLEKLITDIRNKYDYTVFRVEMLILDLNEVIM